MRPKIIVSSIDIERLEALIDSLPHAEAAAQHRLLDELARADVVEPDQIPPTVVTMNSKVRFATDQPGEEFCMTLVYPKDLKADSDQISVLTPVGNALLGLSVGDSIEWTRPNGVPFEVTVLEVVYQPEREGELHR